MKKKTKKTPKPAQRASVYEVMGQWMVRDNRIKRMICLCTKEEDAHLISGLLNRGDLYVA